MPRAIPLMIETPLRTSARARVRVIRSPYAVEFRVPTIETRGFDSADSRPMANNSPGGYARSRSSIGYSEDSRVQRWTGDKAGCAIASDLSGGLRVA